MSTTLRALRAYLAEMTDRPVDTPSGDSAADPLKPVRDEELTVGAAVWESWVMSARSAADKGQFWGIIVAIGAGGLSAGTGLLLLLPSQASWSVLFYAPVVGSMGAWIASARVRRRRFGSTAVEMRSHLVPGLLRAPSDDELSTLASTGHALLRREYAVARVEDRLDLYAIRVLEYAPDQLPWGGGTEASIGFAGG